MQGVVYPLMVVIAGFGSMQVYIPSKGVHTCIDFHGKVPAAATADMWADLIEGEARDGFGFILEGWVNDIGYQAITVPGSLKAYYEAQKNNVDEARSYKRPRVEPDLAIEAYDQMRLKVAGAIADIDKTLKGPK